MASAAPPLRKPALLVQDQKSGLEKTQKSLTENLPFGTEAAKLRLEKGSSRNF
jgi:hypothetical protein